ncbi:MAG: hypothetical protein K8R18_14855 [Parvibaculum sp.]|uniref:COG4648 family protein n=1 Tax=Parvibaculum sp. TaxID=2024848 RepID=UPI002600895C|nr:hypothetical protein [Parvibaculum sp.]MCE9650896.1 hypothetical protein [Parvibaculum sp.]
MSSSARRLNPWAAALAIITLLFPPIAALGMHWIGPWPIVGGLIAMLLLRVVLPGATPVPVEMTLCLLAVAAGELFVGFYDPEFAARLYPVFMNMTMLFAFALTLWKPPSMIERFARIAEPDLDAHGVAYTRNVTWLWMGFFVVNGSLAFWTALYGSWQQWGVYNGAISYVLAGCLFAGEFIIRKIVRARKSAA